MAELADPRSLLVRKVLGERFVSQFWCALLG